MFARVLATLVLAGAPATVHADKGMRAGAGLMGIDANEVDVPFVPGLVLGAYYSTPFNRVVSFQPEVVLSQHRAVHVTCPATGDCMDDGDITLWHLEIPLLLRFDVLPGERTRFHLDAGLEAVLTLGGSQTDRESDTTEVFTDLAPGNAGIVLGAGVELATGPGRLAFDVRYQHWFLPIASADDSDDDVNPEHGLMATVGYAFP
jgi:hypothetical protein